MPGDGGPIVLVVDDDPGVRLVCRTTLERAGYEVREAATPAETLERLREEPIALVLLDLSLVEPHDGEELGRRIGEEYPQVAIVAFSGTTPLHGWRRSWAREAVPKPFTLAELIQTVDRALGGPFEE